MTTSEKSPDPHAPAAAAADQPEPGAIGPDPEPGAPTPAPAGREPEPRAGGPTGVASEYGDVGDAAAEAADDADNRDESDEGDEVDEGDDDGMLGSLPESVRQRFESWVPEMVKKAVAAGVGAVFTTEESLRQISNKITKDMPMPKEVAGYLVNTASTTKDELFRIMAREIREFLQSVNLSEEIAKMLTTLSFEVKTEIRFIPNDQKYGGVEPDVKSKVRLKRVGGTEQGGGRRRMFRRRGEPEAGGGGAGGGRGDDS